MQQDNQQPDLGPAQALKNGYREVRGRTARACGKIRIDYLLDRGTIDEMQHLCCMRLRVAYEGSHRTRTIIALMQEREALGITSDEIEVNRLTQEEHYHFLLAELSPLHSRLLNLVVIGDETLTAACSAIGGVDNNLRRSYLHDAIEELQEAHDKWRKFKDGEYRREVKAERKPLTQTENQLEST
jgi:hypothetical protein